MTTFGVFWIMVVVTAIIYYPSLQAPWYLDDIPVIVQNPMIRNLGESLGTVFQARGPAVSSFALNFYYGGLDPFGYHLVNLSLHLCCGYIIFLLLRRVERNGVLLPALGALLFIAHPLQTQAVTYVVQRMAILAACFFLLSLYLFVRARERLTAGVSFAAPGHLSFYLAAIFAGSFAFLSKENTVVLPLVLYLFVRLLLPPANDSRRLLLSLLPLAALSLILVAVRLLLPLSSGQTLAKLAGISHLPSANVLSPLHYLVTEFVVLWIYIRMLVLPYGQALEHGVDIATSLLEWRHLFAGAGLLLLGFLAVKIRRRQPLITAGIAWFFLTLAVESSVIPLDPLYEHRLYLPMFGFVLVLLGLMRRLPGSRSSAVVLLVMVISCLLLSWQRNRLWADPIAFYQDNLAKTPGNERVLTDLSLLLQGDGQSAAAEKLLLQALESHPDYIPAMMGLIGAYNSQRRLSEALAVARRGVEKYPHSPVLLRALATLYSNSGDIERAVEILGCALEDNSEQVPLLIDRAIALARLGHLPEAEVDFRKALSLAPGNPEARNGHVLILKGQDKPVN